MSDIIPTPEDAASATCRSRAPALEALAAVVVPLLEGRGWHRDPSSHPLHTRRC